MENQDARLTWAVTGMSKFGNPTVAVATSGVGYSSLVKVVSSYGAEVPSRGGPTREAVGLVAAAPANWLPARKRFSRPLLCVEALSIIAGVFSLEKLAAAAPHAALELFTPTMAYGPRLFTQMPRVVRRLREEPETRQAVCFVGSEDDCMSSDLPCTIALHFLQRRGQLTLFAHMRSWDLIKGLSYDIPCFGWVLQAVASCVGVVPYRVVVNADSAHVYEGDMPKFEPLPGSPAATLVSWWTWPDWQKWALRALEKTDWPTLPEGVEFRD